MRLAYADPPYPGKAHLYPENTEVDHIELIARLSEYDGWALSTDEINLRHVLALCPPRTRVLAWCRTTAPPFQPYPFASWEPVLCIPARQTGIEPVRSFCVTAAPTGRAQQDGLTGQKPAEFCRWVIRCLGATQDDELDDLFPGTGVMGDTFQGFCRQLSLVTYQPAAKASYTRRANMARRNGDTLDGESAPVTRERKHSGRT
jgi:hypothetical protein